MRPIEVTYLQGNILEDINSGRAGHDQFDKDKLIKTFEASNSFDIVACQFAVHFAMKNENTWRIFISRVSSKDFPGIGINVFP